ncbi:MAG: M1 family aminopeptidase [Candidatus Tectimicrobiota bacterium]
MSTYYCRRAGEDWSAQGSQAPRQGRRAFALPQATVHYAPDSPCNVVHIALTLCLDLEQQSLQGTCATTVRAVQDGLREVTMDAVALQISQVRQPGGPLLDYDYDGRTLRIILAEALAREVATTVEVDYRVSRPRLGLYFIAPDAAYPHKPVQVWSQCQDEDARYWFPCFDAPNVKASTEMRLTIPQRYFALSNGHLLNTTYDDASGTSTYHWLQDQPHSTYLITLVVGEFRQNNALVDGTPVQWYVEPGREADGQRAFGDTPAMVRFFSQKLGVPYPWNKYAQIAVSDFIFGGMENTSATTQTDLTLHDRRAHLDFSSNGLVAHELAHQWFGNLVTCKSWAHAWLNEGFATYCDALFHEHAMGVDEFRYYMHQKALAYFREDSEHYRRAIVTNVYQEPIDLFDRHLYDKGALVLHMLRHLLGEEPFWRSLQHYLQTHRYQVVETVDLERAIEASTGRNLRAFFRQWLYQGGYPEYELEYAWDEATHLATLTIRQQQKTGSEHGVETPLFDVTVTLLLALPETEQRLTIRLHEAVHTLHLVLPARPRWLSVDPGNWILKKLRLKLPPAMLQAQLQHDPEVMGRIYAAEALGELGSLEAVQSLRQALAQDPFWGVQAEIARLLGKLRTPAALAVLLAHTSLPHPKARRAVATALGEFKEAQVAALLATMLQQGDASYFVEAEAAAALGKTRCETAFPVLAQALNTPSWNDTIRAGVCRGLAELRDDRAIPLLRDLSAYGQPLLARCAAIRALGTLGSAREPAPEPIVETLTALLDEEHFRIRMAVLDALAALQSPQTLAALERLRARDVDGRVQRRLTEVLETIRSARRQTDEVQQLRDDVQSLRADNQKLLERLERLEASRPDTSSATPAGA